MSAGRAEAQPLSPGNSSQRTRKHSRCNTMPRNPSIFHLLSSAAKLGQRRAAQRGARLLLPRAHLRARQGPCSTAAGEETRCSQKPQPEGQERLALGGAPGGSSGTQRKGCTRGHHLQTTSWMEIHSDAACPSPCLCCQITQIQSKPDLGGSSTVFLHLRCTFPAQTLQT